MFFSMQRIATLVLAAVAAIGTVDLAVAYDPPTQTGERKCRPATAQVTHAQCTVTGQTYPSNGCPLPTMVRVAHASCTSSVTEYADDACNGALGTCVPPVFSGGSLASITDYMIPDVKIGTCYDTANPDYSCHCVSAEVAEFCFGRFICTTGTGG